MNENQLSAIANYTRYHHDIWSGELDQTPQDVVDWISKNAENGLKAHDIEMFLDTEHNRCLCFVIGEFVLPITDCTWAYEGLHLK